MEWCNLYYKLRDPNWTDRSNFFSKLKPKEESLLMEQLKKELKHEEGLTLANKIERSTDMS